MRCPFRPVAAAAAAAPALLLLLLLLLQDLTPRAKDSLVSFGERLSTRIFASFLREQVQSLGSRVYSRCLTRV
jgi:aspartokinase